MENYYSRDKTIKQDIFEDEVINILENLSDITNNTSINKSKNGLSYHLTLTSVEWPKVELTISRQKVLKICSLLKQNDLWITDKSNIDEIASLVFVILSKDTILSEAEVESLKLISLNIAKKAYNEKEKSKYKGVKR